MSLHELTFLCCVLARLPLELTEIKNNNTTTGFNLFTSRPETCSHCVSHRWHYQGRG